MKLTKVQERALSKLTYSWTTAYAIKESISTLHSLLRAGLVDYKPNLGSVFSPRTSTLWRKKK